jgi:hypothetical protein
MKKTCPQCGFESIDEQSTCPNCGFEFVNEENETTPVTETDSNTPQQNDDIRWSDYKDVPLGELIEHFEDKNEAAESPKDQTEIQSESQNEASDLVEESKTEEQSLEEKDSQLVTEPEVETDEAEAPETEATTESDIDEESHDTAILSAYIRQHKNSDTDEEAVDSLEEKDEAEAQPVEEQPDESEVAVEDTQTEATPVIEAEQETEPQATEQPEEQATQPIKAEEKPVEESSKDTAGDTSTPTKNKKSRKKFYVAAAALVLVAAGGWYYYEEQQQAQQVQAETASALDKIEADLAAFYTDDQQEFIKADKTTADLTAVTNRLTKYQEESRYSDLLAQTEVIKEKLAILTEINAYFASPIIVEDQLKDVSLKEASAVTMKKQTGDTAFDKLVNQAIDKGQAEYAQIEEVQNAVKSTVALNKDGKLSDKVTRESYTTLMKKIEALPIASLKESLTAEMTPIDTALKKKEAAKKAEQEAAAAAEAAAEEQAAQEQASQAAAAQSRLQSSEAEYVLSPNSPTNTNNQPIIPARESDLADTNNPAWNWAAGVQEKIIATAIARGYVVEGGYTFERVRIVNGEGYYNFYATNNQGSLLKGTSESALPMYLFTVNAKTGYFRGNGNDHTVR